MFFWPTVPKRHGPPTLSLSLAWLCSAGRSTTQEESQQGWKQGNDGKQRAGGEPRGRGTSLGREPRCGTRPSHPAEEEGDRRGKVGVWLSTLVQREEGRREGTGEWRRRQSWRSSEARRGKDFPLVFWTWIFEMLSPGQPQLSPILFSRAWNSLRDLR